jgi:energy-coupling factor transporter ATP-binding protein EcfA2
MRADVKRGNEDAVFGLLYIGAHVLALGLGCFFGHYLFDKPIYEVWLIDLLLLIPLYVVIYFANVFAGAGLAYVSEFFKRRNLFDLLGRLNMFSFTFLSYLVLFSFFLLLVFLFSGWKGLLNIGTYVLIYFILPLGLSLFAMNLIGKAMGYSFSLEDEEKAMVQGSQSSAVSPANHREVKADKPIVWNFADYAKRWVVGQDHAIETIQKVLIANSKLADLGNPKRQRILASFLFVGPTGVGKTETAKALASWLKDYGYDSLRIDANQFSDRESTWTLLGSPKGYVGSDKPGLLPSAISQNPKRIILIDEIEKADQGFYQFLLQMLDEGYVIERSTGNVYYLQRAIVIITSNLENKRIAEIMEKLSDPIQIDIAVRKTLEGAEVWLGGGRTFRITPEFLGRIDAVVPFRSLGFEDLVQIAYRELRDLGLHISYETVYELTQKYYPVAREYGVRYFLKKVQEDVLTQ